MKSAILKAMLYAYPHLGEMAEAACTAGYNKAILSFLKPGTADMVASDVAEEFYLCKKLRALEADIGSAKEKFSKEELALLEVKYFARGREGLVRLREEDGYFRCSEGAMARRSYFRRQALLLKKFGRLMAEMGYTDEFFLREYGGIRPFPRLLAVLAARSKGRGILRLHSSPRGGAFLACKTRTASPTAPARTMTMSTISRTSEGSSGSSGSPETGGEGACSQSSLSSKVSGSAAGI